MIKLQDGQFGTYLIVNVETDADILIQSTDDFLSIANIFGWDGDESDLSGAIEYLDDNIGAIVEDPGYFDA